MTQLINTTNKYFIPASTQKRWLLAAACTLLAVYFINCFTPLRINYDAIRYFALAEQLEGTWPHTFGNKPDFLPYGYVLFLVALSKLGILNAFFISFFQLIFLGGSLYFVTRLFNQKIQPLHLVLLTTLNWTAIKFTITPVSEMQFLFFSAGALYYFQRHRTTQKLRYIITATLFAIAALFTRIVGILLIASFLITLFITYRQRLLQWMRQPHGKIIATATCGTCILLCWQLHVFTYLGYFFRPLWKDPAAFFVRNINRHILDWASIFVNAPVEKFSFLTFYNWISFLYLLAGIFFLWIIGRRLLSKTFSVPLHIRTYLILYILVIFNWPFFEPRFWFPVMPLLLAVVVQKATFETRFYKTISTIAMVCYTLAGIAALSYYTYLTINKNAFARNHENGLYRPEYEWHYFKTRSPRLPTTYRDSTIFLKAAYIIRKYD